MFGINNEKLINKLRTEVIPDIMNQNVEDIVKYNLALKYLIETTDVKNNEVYVVGDSANDISMFKIFENSFLILHKDNHLKIKNKYKSKKFSDLEKYTRLNKNFS